MNAAAPTILLMDDQEPYRYACAKTLERAGYAVIGAEDYRDALSTVESGRQIDLLIADIIMPKGLPHGLAVARMAKARRPSLKVMFITAYYDQLPEDEIERAPGPVLRKPADIAELLPTIETVLREAPAR